MWATTLLEQMITTMPIKIPYECTARHPQTTLNPNPKTPLVRPWFSTLNPIPPITPFLRP